jgi:hypothetical protein
MTMGPEIFAWIGAGGLMDISPKLGCGWGGRDQAARRFAVTSTSIFISGL